jgi:hypothetical protein
MDEKNMKENIEFLKDYKDCLNRIINFDTYNYVEIDAWAVKKYAEWVKKDKRYELSLTGGTNISNDDRQKAWNAINNFRVALDKIAVIKEFKI